MATFTPEQYEHYKAFVDTHFNEVAEFIMNSKYDFTPESLIKLGNDEAQKNFMDFPDYDENEPLGIEDSLVVLYFDYVEDDIEFNKLYDFFCENLKYCLWKLTGAEN